MPIVKSQRREDGNQADPDNGDFAGEGHTSIQAELPAMRNRKVSLPTTLIYRRCRTVLLLPAAALELAFGPFVAFLGVAANADAGVTGI